MADLWNPFEQSNAFTPMKAARVVGTGNSRTLRTASVEPFVGENGEINADSKADLIAAHRAMAAAARNPQMLAGDGRDEIRASKAASAESVKRQREIVAAAMKSDEAMMKLGADIGEVVMETTGRESFHERMLMSQTVPAGQTAKWEFQPRDMVAYEIVNADHIMPAYTRSHFVYPTFRTYAGQVRIEEAELAVSSSGILDRKFNEMAEQVFRKGDLRFVSLLNTLAPTANEVFGFTNLTPSTFQAMRTAIRGWGLPVSGAIMALDLWDDIITTDDFSNWFDPVHKHELVKYGQVGSILNTQILTDGYRHPKLRVLSDGNIYMLTVPEALGGINIHQELRTNPINGYNAGELWRGWLFSRMYGMTILNSRGIVRGRRL